MKLWKFAIVPAALAVAGVLFMRFGMRGDVNGADARTLVATGARLVDVRSPDEFTEGHLPDAVNIPVGDLTGRLGELGPRDTAIIVYCRSGVRSSRAAKLLREQGFSRVRNLGAMSAW